MLANEQLSSGKGPTSPVGTQHTPTVIETSPQLQNLSIAYRKTRNRTRRTGIRIPQSNVLSSVTDEAITKEMHDRLGEAILEEGNISRSGEGSMQLLELIDICIKLSDKVTALEEELRSTKAIYNKSLITLTKRVKKLENKLKLKRRSAIIDSSEDEEASLDIKDPSKQGRMIEELDQDENVNLVISSKQREAHETAEHRMDSGLDFSTASPQNDDDEITFAKTLIGHDEELAQKLHAEELEKSTARQEQEKYDFEKSLELQKQFDEREEVVAKSIQAYDIDWSDPAVIRFHTLQNRSFSVAEVRKNMCMYLKNQGGYKQSHFKGLRYEDIRHIFESVWDQNHAFVPKDSEIEKEVMKRSVQQDDVITEQVVKESYRKDEGRLKRKALKAREDKDKRQKKQDDPENLTLMEYVKVIYDSEEMLNDFDREDLIVLYRLFNEKYASTRPGFDDLMLWGDMKIMFEPDDDDAVWKNHNSQELIEWKLYDSCGVHSLMLGEGSDEGDNKKFEDISSLDPPKSAPLNYEPLGNSD
ncbi:hypothetical protein Tco_0520703 [Tanacetum coccineum]